MIGATAQKGDDHDYDRLFHPFFVAFLSHRLVDMRALEGMLRAFFHFFPLDKTSVACPHPRTRACVRLIVAVFCCRVRFTRPDPQALPMDPTVLRDLRSLRKAESSWDALLDPGRCYRFVYALQVIDMENPDLWREAACCVSCCVMYTAGWADCGGDGVDTDLQRLLWARLDLFSS